MIDTCFSIKTWLKSPMQAAHEKGNHHDPLKKTVAVALPFREEPVPGSSGFATGAGPRMKDEGFPFKF